MKKIYANQSGFGVVEILLVVVVLSVTGFAGWRFMGSNSGKTVNRQSEIIQTPQLSELDKKTLEKAMELKKIDFDLDGQVNSEDADDDNDGQDDEVDNDDDNDGELDDIDADDDNDGANDDSDDETVQQAELQEADVDEPQSGESNN